MSARPTNCKRIALRLPPSASPNTGEPRSSVRPAPQDAAHLRRAPPDPGVRVAHFSPRSGTHLARARPAAQTPPQISAQTGPGAHQSAVGPVPANQRRHERSRRYPALWAASPTPALAADPVHRPKIRSGLLFWAFAQKRSAAASAVFASRIQQHLDRYGVTLRDLVWQTDNGGEFKGDFPEALGDSQHVRIPPAAHTY